MNPEVQQKVTELAEALSQTEEFKRFQEAQEEVEQHEAAKIMLRDFAEHQRQMQARVANGEQPSEEELRQYEQRAQVVSLNPYLRPLLESEYAFSQMVNEVQTSLLAALGLVSPEQIAEQSETGEGDDAGGGDGRAAGEGEAGTGSAGERPARSRLWTPGSGTDPGISRV